MLYPIKVWLYFSTLSPVFKYVFPLRDTFLFCIFGERPLTKASELLVCFQANALLQCENSLRDADRHYITLKPIHCLSA